MSIDTVLPTPAFDLVIRTLNEEDHLGNLLSAVEGQTITPVTTVVIDSGSSDATVSIAARFGAQIEFIKSEDFTFGRSLNRGIAACSSPLVVIASAHVLPQNETWLERLVAPLAANGNCVVSFGMQRGSKESAFSEQQVMRKWFPESSEPRQSHPFCNNANAAIRRRDWLSCQFEEELPGLEDMAYAQSLLRDPGSFVSYVADAGVVHIHDESLSGIVRRYSREALAYGVIGGDRLRAHSAAALFAANSARDMAAAIKRSEFARQFRPILRFRAAQFYGAYQGGREAVDRPRQEVLRRRYYYPNRIERMPRKSKGGAPEWV